MFVTIFLSIFSALLCAISLPNEVFLNGLWPLGFISLIPFYIALRRARSHRQAAITGAVFGAFHHALTSYWLFFYKDFAFWTLGSTTLAYAVVYAAVGIYASFVVRNESPILRPFVFAVGWTAFEFLKSTGFLGYPWGLLPYSLSSIPILLQIADTTGVYGLSFLLALSSAIGAEFIRKSPGEPRPARGALFLIMALSMTLLYGLVISAIPIPQKAILRATLVQQNTDPWISGELAALEANIDLAGQARNKNSAEGALPADLLIFSETSLRRPYAEYRQWFEKNPKAVPLLPFVEEGGAPLLTGAPIVLDWDSYEATNSVILLSAQGELLESYAKIHPVPFAEAIPLWEYEWFRKFMKEVVGLESGWVMGTKITLFHIPVRSPAGTTLTFGTPICFEDAFADLCRQYFLEGADLLVNLTNDSWSRKKSAQIQHWAIARIRAIENRRTLVRSTNSGVSCVVDAWGKNIEEVPQFEAAAVTVDIPIYKTGIPTIYTRFGDWFARICTLLLILRGSIDCMRFRRKLSCTESGNVFY
jgi:apolipoprotein N-acyltransferase